MPASLILSQRCCHKMYWQMLPGIRLPDDRITHKTSRPRGPLSSPPDYDALIGTAVLVEDPTSWPYTPVPTYKLALCRYPSVMDDGLWFFVADQPDGRVCVLGFRSVFGWYYKYTSYLRNIDGGCKNLSICDLKVFVTKHCVSDSIVFVVVFAGVCIYLTFEFLNLHMILRI